MKGVRDDVNTQLKREGEPIRIGIGMEFGEILWSRIGVLGRTQVKPISEATFLAGKLSTSKYTDPWQAKVGADLAAWIPADLKQKSQRYEFTMEGKQYARELFLFDWQAFGKEFQSGSDQLRKRLLARKLSSPITIASITTGAVPVSGSGPRKLKDQPFF
jgi:hypothetical protein